MHNMISCPNVNNPSISIKVVLLTICAKKIECLKSEFPKKDIPDIEKALFGLKAIVEEAAC